MADLEEHAFRRDGRFIVRLLILLAVGIAAGLVVYGKLTSSEVGGCAAESFGGVGSTP